MATVIYEGADDALIYGRATLPRGVPTEVGDEDAAKLTKRDDVSKHTPEDASTDLSKANKATLTAEAEARGLDASGTNKEIRERIEAHDAAPTEKPEDDDPASDSEAPE